MRQSGIVLTGSATRMRNIGVICGLAVSFCALVFGIYTLLYQSPTTQQHVLLLNEDTGNRKKIENNTLDILAVSGEEIKQAETGVVSASIATWLERRKEGLNSDRPRKVLLFCYMRGGSTFFSELFMQNPDALYFYEPLAGFYASTYGLPKFNYPMHGFYDHDPSNNAGQPSVRSYPEWERQLVADFHHNMVNCNVGDLPMDLLAHRESLRRSPQLSQYTNCIKSKQIKACGTNRGGYGIDVCGKIISTAIKQQCAQKIAIAKQRFSDPTSALIHDPNMTSPELYPEQQMQKFYTYSKCQKNMREKVRKHCTLDLENKCKNKKLVAYKALRISMDSVPAILEKDPDTFVIFYVRDPRATVSSTKATGGLMSHYSGPHKSSALEAKYLCSKMKHDLELYQKYDKQYPGAIRMLKYEHLCREPARVARELYEYIGVPINPSVLKWIDASQQSSASGGPSSTKRASWTASINKWRTKFPNDVADEMSVHCRDVLQTLDYKLT